MTSRERILAAIDHRQPDRVPVNYLGTPETDQKLRAHFGLTPPGDVRPGDMVDNDWDLLDCLGGDLRTLRLHYTGPALARFDDGRAQNYWGVIKRPVRNETGLFMESCYLPFAGFESLDDVEKYAWPSPDWFDYAGLAGQCEAAGDRAVIYGWPGNGDLINGTAFARGFETTIMGIATNDPVTLACMEKRFEFHLEQSRRALAACAGRVDILWIGDDFGTQRGLLLSPAKWRTLFKARLRAFADLAHGNGARLMLHCCGSTYKIWPELIDAGVDVYDTVQPEAAGMNPRALFAQFGGYLAMHGTVSTQKTLPFGTPEDVAQEVRDRLEFGAGGGLILAPSHNIQTDTPVENVLALYRAAGSM